MKINPNILLVGLVVMLLISNLSFGYMLFFNKNNSLQRGFQNTQLTDTQKQSVTSFFESTTDTTEIDNYCKQNMIGCFYYCREINSANSFCSQMQKGSISQTAQRLN